MSVSCLSSWLVVSVWLIGLVGVEVSLGKFSIFASGFQLVGCVGLVVVFELVVFPVSCLSSWFLVSSLLELKFLFENFQFLPQVLSWLVGLVGLLVFELVVFPVSCLSSWFLVSSWLVGLVGVEVSLLKF